MMLIDTNIFVDHFRGYKDSTKFFETLIERNDVLFSAITEAELVSGKECNDRNRKEKILYFLCRWNKIPVSNQIACLAGDINRGYYLSIPDAIIAATAMVNNAELLTRNFNGFKKIPSLKIRVPY